MDIYICRKYDQIMKILIGEKKKNNSEIIINKIEDFEKNKLDMY